MYLLEKIENTKVVIWNRKSKNRQHIGQMQKDKKIYNLHGKDLYLSM